MYKQNISYDYSSNPVMIIESAFDSSKIKFLQIHLSSGVKSSFLIVSKRMKIQTFAFKQKSITLLPSPFKSNCIKYRNDDGFGTLHSFKNCVHDCFNEAIFRNFQCRFSKNSTEFFESKTDLCFNQSLSRRTKINRMMPEFYKKCNEIKCSSNCDGNIYSYRMVSESDHGNNQSIIKIFPSSRPNMKYIYLSH
jgi:hypothetical protein